MLSEHAAHAKDQRNAKATLEHRHFATIAAIIEDAFGEHNTSSEWDHADIALAFADHLVDTNPRFDRKRFLRACGVT